MKGPSGLFPTCWLLTVISGVQAPLGGSGKQKTTGNGSALGHNPLDSLALSKMCFSQVFINQKAFLSSYPECQLLLFPRHCLFIYFYFILFILALLGLCCGRQAFSSCGACRLSCPVACGILASGSGIKRESPALQGRFLTTGPPEKSLRLSFKMNSLY